MLWHSLGCWDPFDENLMVKTYVILCKVFFLVQIDSEFFGIYCYQYCYWSFDDFEVKHKKMKIIGYGHATK